MAAKKPKALFVPSKRAAAKTADITFAEGHPFHGLEVTVALMAPLDFVLSIEHYDSLPATRKRELMKQFGDTVLREWNVGDVHGNERPANGDSFLAEDYEFTTAVMTAWVEQMTQPSVPFAERSNGTGP